MSEPRYTAWQVIGVGVLILALVAGAGCMGLLVGFTLGRATARPVLDFPQPGPVLPPFEPMPVEPSGPPYLGVRYVSVTPDLAREEGLPVEAGALLRSVDSGSPAELAGLLRGDVITEVNGVVLSANRDLRFVVSQYSPGDELKLAVARGDRILTVRVTLGSNIEDD
ncbi:MAG TPA: PDZ domain-containing protein [Anaerolineales bacterium]|nr:PDZ domain-containing protein [Anaerolineales bacterium]